MGSHLEESSQHQYRFEDIIDLNTGEVLFKLDHEMRSLDTPAVRASVGEPESRPDEHDVRRRTRDAIPALPYSG